MRQILLVGCICSLLLSLTWAAAAAPAELTLLWWTVDSGGGTLAGSGSSGAYTLSGAAGQPDAGVLEGGGFTLDGGFIGGGVTPGPEYQFYLPLIVRNR